MENVNLLPEWVKRPQKRRKLMVKMATIQVAIFILLSVGYLILSTMIFNNNELLLAQATRPLQSQNEILGAIDYNNITVALAVAEYLYGQHINFDSLWVIAAITTTPDNATLTRLDYREGEIFLRVASYNIASAEIHRQSLLDTKLFDWVWLGRITGAGGGIYNYEIRIGVNP